MNSSSLDRFRRRASATARALKPGTVKIGATSYAATVFHGSDTVENERGGRVPVRTMVIHVDKTLLPAAPAIGTRLTHTESGRTGELYQIGGVDGPHWILRTASFPDRAS